MKKIVDYRLVAEDYVGEFEEEAKSLLVAGYTPHGSPFTTERYVYNQAMVKYEEENESI